MPGLLESAVAATAAVASTFSATEIGSPMARSSATNAARLTSIDGRARAE